jgi:Regulator of Chromosome Condensation (RCC1) repeat protein
VRGLQGFPGKRPAPGWRTLCVCVLALLSVGLSVAPAAGRETVGGTVIAWGCGSNSSLSGPCSVPTDLSGVTALAAGPSQSLALKNDGTVVAWGCGASRNDQGQCTVPAGLSRVTAIASGDVHSLALRSDGTVVAWGCGSSVPAITSDVGQCSVPAGLSGVTAIAAGQSHSLALKNDGTVVAWGCRAFPSGTPTDAAQCSVPAGLSGVTAIAAGAFHSLALKNDGSVVAWGCGSLRLPPFFVFPKDVGQCSVPAGLTGVIAVAAGAYHSLALKNDGTVIAWGCGADPSGFSYDAGQCTLPAGLSGVTAIAAGSAHSLALKGDRTVVTWGCAGPVAQPQGQCSVPDGLINVTAIAAGSVQTLAVFTDTPAITLLSARASGKVVVVKVKLSDWKMYPDLAGKKPNKPDGGHWRIFVDGRFNNRATQATTGKTTKLKPGKHRIWVILANNDDTAVAGAQRSKTLAVIVKKSR